jgi:hypothetical protein
LIRKSQMLKFEPLFHKVGFGLAAGLYTFFSDRMYRISKYCAKIAISDMSNLRAKGKL